MPYEHLAGVHIGDEELYAAVPNWIAASHGHDTGVNAPDVGRRAYRHRAGSHCPDPDVIHHGLTLY